MIKRGRYSATKKPANKRNSGSIGQIRIIGGKNRGRKLPVHDSQGLRPTTDRVKETLFNWLQADIRDANCLDLFAGSGSLGFEAVSRFANKVTFVEKEKKIAQQLKENITTLKADNTHVINQNALAFLDQSNEKFDIVFLDPPFRQELLVSVIEKLETNNLLTDNAIIYLEAEKELNLSEIPPTWILDKEKTAGQVSFKLYRRKEK